MQGGSRVRWNRNLWVLSPPLAYRPYTKFARLAGAGVRRHGCGAVKHSARPTNRLAAQRALTSSVLSPVRLSPPTCCTLPSGASGRAAVLCAAGPSIIAEAAARAALPSTARRGTGARGLPAGSGPPAELHTAWCRHARREWLDRRRLKGARPNRPPGTRRVLNIVSIA